MIVTREDAASLGYCNSGIRAYFAAHGFDWPTFMRQGFPDTAFDRVKTDPMIKRLLAAAAIRNGR